jgi:mannose-6-phosphate isomerase-like protein (cupin superfamily)
MTISQGVDAAPAMVRRVVTGLDAEDKAVVLFDSRLPLTSAPGRYPIASSNLWITESYPPALTAKDTLRPIGVSPPKNGTKFRVIDFPPLDAAAEAAMPPDFVARQVDPLPARGRPATGNPMMHRTRSLDYAVVLSGEIDMMLDDSIVHVRAGDVVVQQATNHAWVNRGTATCRMLFVLMDSQEP